MGWKERLQGRVDEVTKKSRPKAEKLRDDTPELIAGLREKTERTGESVKSMFNDIAQSFREGANGDEPGSQPRMTDEVPPKSD